MAEKKVQICREDGAAIKRVLDDHVVKYITEQEKYTEDTSYSNLTLLLSAISVALALTAQFYPAAFPQNYYVLLVCAASYFTLSGILQYMVTYKQKDNILFTVGEHIDSQGLQIASRLPKYDYNYTISISERNTQKNEVTLTKSVGEWIDVKGFFHEDLLYKDVGALLEKYNRTEEGRKKTK
eukprot:TRINITY_DN2124_c0_g1_i1.p1 TRINITY_DN2124_c0_g1~~TRINITY_DN2124_c0_g1_i1.p1  ORF type:complete len:208 (+),score=37.45 TRINITY_DN2124_c0_g1_i1:80-625(+)